MFFFVYLKRNKKIRERHKSRTKNLPSFTLFVVPENEIHFEFLPPPWSKMEKTTDKMAIESFTVSRVSGASERANGRASGPVLQSVFLAVIDHSAEWVGPILPCGTWVIDTVMQRQIIDVVFEERVKDAVWEYG